MSDTSFRCIDDLYPLTALQRLWVARGRGPRRAEHHKHLGWQYGGALDLQRLSEAWRAVTDRHVALRSSFFWDGVAEPVQIVHRDVNAALVVHDLRGMADEEQEEQLARVLRDDRDRGFDLELPPLHRLLVFRIADEFYRVVWSMEGPVVDSWSQPIVIKDLFQFYERNTTGASLVSAEPPRYRDFVAWRAGCSFEGAEAVWRRQLDPFRGITSVCGGRRGEESAPEHADQVVPVDFAMFADLERIARVQQITLNTMVMGAWALVQARHCGTDHVVFGITLSGRSPAVAAVDRMVGFFMNILPVGARIRRDMPFVAFAAELHGFLQQLHRYEHLPADWPARWYASDANSFLFDCLFVFENYPVFSPGEEVVAGVDLRETQGVVTSAFPLTVIVSKGWEWLQMLYDLTCIDHDTVRHLLHDFTACLVKVAAAPARPLGDLARSF